MGLRTSVVKTIVGVCVLSLCGCGASEIDSALVREGNVLNAQPTVYREDSQLVSGLVVKRDANGQILESVEYVDGFPQGVKKTFYPNGQLKTEAVLKLRTHNRGAGLINVGPARSYCENGTLAQERLFDEEGTAYGEHRTWTCSGILLTLTTLPEGKYYYATESPDGSVRLTEEGIKTADNKWQGEHKRYHPDGAIALIEHWQDGKLHGAYQQIAPDGTVVSSGQYEAGKQIGLWRNINNGLVTLQDFDIANFIAPEYAGPFMQAAGIANPASTWGAKYPLKDYRVDLEKLRYYVNEGLVDPARKLHVGGFREPFVSTAWTYPYVMASREALEMLAELGADPAAKDSNGRSRLHHCIYSLGDTGVCSGPEIKRLIDLGSAADDPDIRNTTPLMELVLISWNFRWMPSVEQQLEVAQILLDAGADPDRIGGRDELAPQKDNMSPLMAAVHARRFKLARLLMDNSKNPQALHKAGFNLIHFAFLDPGLRQFDLRMQDDAREFIEHAVAAGIDPNLPLDEVGTLKQVAQRAGAIDLAQYFAKLSGQ